MLEFVGGILTGAALWHLLQRRGRSRETPGLADLLPYAYAADDRLILLKDGSLLAGYRLEVPDLETTSEEERQQRWTHLHKTLLALPPNWSIEVNLHRLPVRPYPPLDGAAFPTRSLAELERCRSEHFNEHLGHRFIITEITLFLCHTPQRNVADRIFERALLEGPKSTFQAELDRFIDATRRQLHDLKDLLSSVYKLRELSVSEMLTECHRCLTGQYHPIFLDRFDTYLAPVVASTDLYAGIPPVIGGRYVMVAHIGHFGEGKADMLRLLTEYPDELRFHLRFLPISRRDVLRRLSIRRNLWHIKFQGLAGMSGRLEKQIPGDEYMTDESARQMLEDMQQLKAEIDDGKVSVGILHNVILMFDTDPDRGHARMSRLLATLRERGLTVDYERLHATAAFLSSLPGCGGANLRKTLYTSAFSACLFPLTAPWAGRPFSPCSLLRQGTRRPAPPLMVTLTRGGTPYRLNLHVGDVGHTLIVGGTGGGKSVLVDMICHSWLRYSGSRVVVLDVDRSHYLLTLAAGGRFVDPATDFAFQPLRDIQVPQERAWAAELIRLLVSFSHQMTSAEQRELSQVLEDLANSPRRTLSELAAQLSQKLRDSLRPYLRGSDFPYLDGDAEQFDLSERVTAIEIGAFANAGQQRLLPLLEVIFHRIEQALRPEHPTLIVVEESWMALQHEGFARRVQEWLFRIRKLGGAVVLVGHRPDQFTTGSAINVAGNVLTRIFLPTTDVAAQAEHYRNLGLTDHMLRLLADATPRREYLIWQPDGVRIFELALGKLERYLVGIWEGLQRDEVFEKAKALAQQYPESWLLEIDDVLAQTPTEEAPAS